MKRLAKSLISLQRRERLRGALSAATAFRRERVAVRAGRLRFDENRRSGQQIYALRRYVHMIEKGLTMQPLRTTFATAYIRETLDLAEAFDRAGFKTTRPELWAWIVEVLEHYASATAASADPAVIAARPRINKLTSDTQPFASGPVPPETSRPSVDIESLYELANRRKSVRWYQPRRVPHNVIDKALHIANEAPTACNRQPYRFLIFDDPEMVRQVASIPMGTAGYGQELPGIIVVIGDLSAFSNVRDRHLIYIDSSLAAMSLVFGLESQGVSSVCINWPDIASKERAMRKLLRLELHEKVIMLIGYGFAAPDGLAPFSAKEPINQLREFNTIDS